MTKPHLRDLAFQRRLCLSITPLVFSLLLIPLNCNAQETPKHEVFYLGGGIGTTNFVDVLFDSYDNSANIDVINLDSSDASYSLYGGYHFNRIIGIEISYNDYGKLTTNNRLHGDLTPESFAINANAGYSFDSGWRVFGLAGLGRLDLGQAENWYRDDTSTSFHYGVGGEYQPNGMKGLTFRVNYKADMYTAKLNDWRNYRDTSYIAQIGTFMAAVGYRF